MENIMPVGIYIYGYHMNKSVGDVLTCTKKIKYS